MSNPNNYVYFSCEDNKNPTKEEKWRMIGVMNNIDDGTGNKELRIKMIRSEAIGTFSWMFRLRLLIMEWSQSDLIEELDPRISSLQESIHVYEGLILKRIRSVWLSNKDKAKVIILR